MYMLKGSTLSKVSAFGGITLRFVHRNQLMDGETVMFGSPQTWKQQRCTVPGRDLELGAQVTFEASAMKNGISRYAMFGEYSAYYLYDMYSRFT